MELSRTNTGFGLVEVVACLANNVKDDKLVTKAAWTHESACLRLSDVIFSDSGDGLSSRSGDEQTVMDLERESAIRRIVFKLEWRVKNCSTVGCGLSSFAEELNSEYVLSQKKKLFKN